MSSQVTHHEHDQAEEELPPLFYPSKQLPLNAAFGWLYLGWNDFKRAPLVSLIYGFALVLFGYLLTALAWGDGNTTLLFTLVTGFILIGPVLAFGLYSISRQLELGLKPRLGYCIKESKSQLRNELLFALLLLVVLLIWARAASMVHVFFPLDGDIGWLDWAQFLAIGSAVGSIFATVVFTISAFSLPMMLDRNEDAITSALTSVAAVLKNKGTMLIWGLVVLGLTILGLATAYIGLAVVFPILGHATWHAYRETILEPVKE